MYGIHANITRKIDEIEAITNERTDIPELGEKFTELRRLVETAWTETGRGIGGFGSMID